MESMRMGYIRYQRRSNAILRYMRDKKVSKKL